MDSIRRLAVRPRGCGVPRLAGLPRLAQIALILALCLCCGGADGPRPDVRDQVTCVSKSGANVSRLEVPDAGPRACRCQAAAPQTPSTVTLPVLRIYYCPTCGPCVALINCCKSDPAFWAKITAAYSVQWINHDQHPIRGALDGVFARVPFFCSPHTNVSFCGFTSKEWLLYQLKLGPLPTNASAAATTSVTNGAEGPSTFQPAPGAPGGTPFASSGAETPVNPAASTPASAPGGLDDIRRQ